MPLHSFQDYCFEGCDCTYITPWHTHTHTHTLSHTHTYTHIHTPYIQTHIYKVISERDNMCRSGVSGMSTVNYVHIPIWVYRDNTWIQVWRVPVKFEKTHCEELKKKSSGLNYRGLWLVFIDPDGGASDGAVWTVYCAFDDDTEYGWFIGDIQSTDTNIGTWNESLTQTVWSNIWQKAH